MEELAQILGEELALPRIEPRGKKNIVTTKDKYTGIRQAGPESLRHFKRTFKKALKRQISSGIYDPEQPLVMPIREDKQYRSWKEIPKPESVAVHHLHDGRVRLHDRRAEGDRPHRGVLDRHLDQGPLQGRRDGLHHPRRGRPGSGRAHLLPHARDRRHQDQLGLRAGRQDHQRPLSRRTSGTSTPSTSPTATTGATTFRTASRSCRKSCCRRSTCSATARWKAPTAAASSSSTSTNCSDEKPNVVASRIPDREAILEVDQGVSGHGTLTHASGRSCYHYRARQNERC